MNINKKFLYEEFININLKHRYSIFDFIDKNCPVAPKKKNDVLYEKIKDFKPKDQNDLKKRKERILKNLKLHDYSEVTIFYECERCDLCKYEVFKKNKKILSEMQDDILKKNIPAEKRINNFIEKIEYFNFKVIKDSKGQFALQKGDTLKQIIYFNFIENISEKINAQYQKQNEYFRQIAKLLLVNNDFLNDLENIKGKYFQPREYEGHTIYHPNKEFHKDFFKFQNEIIELRNKYNLTQRWGPYVIHGMLTYPIDSKGELIVSDDQPMPKPPNGMPGRLISFTGSKQLPQRLILVGDESEDTVRATTKKYDIKEEGYRRTKGYKQPLRNYDRNFRWYESYQKKMKNNGKKIKDPIFSEIFYDDISRYPEDWQESNYVKYREKSDELSIDLKEDIEIKGANRIRGIIYRLDNIVYKKEK